MIRRRSGSDKPPQAAISSRVVAEVGVLLAMLIALPD
jgi:hypothetical protein